MLLRAVFRRSVVAVLATVASAVISVFPASTAGATGVAGLAGGCHAAMAATFLPPWWAASWSAGRYAQELSDMKAIGIKTVILQETVNMDANVAYYPSRPGGYPRGADVTGNLLYQAGLQQTNVVLGLSNSNTWATHANDYAWMSHQLHLDEAVADRLYSLYKGTFSGWYIPNEVDDYLLATPPEVAMVTWFVNSLADYLHTHDGNLSVMSSPFYQAAWQTPTQFAQAIGAMFARVDIVNLQDGAGQHRPSGAIAALFSAVAASLGGTHTQLWDDPDMYLMGVGPMPPAQLQANLNAVCGYASVLTGFSFSTQMEPLGVGSRNFYDSYQRYFAG